MDPTDDRYFWELLGLEPGADRRALKRAYHQLARRNHPDFFPPDQKPLQGLRMITLNEAYAHLLRRGAGEVPLEASAQTRGCGEAELGFHREPAYAYYKQGFVHYSRAIHGIQALYRSIRRLHPAHFDPRDDAYERFAGSLSELRQAYDYFRRVEEEHPGSRWAPDARVKLARVERFSELYRRILRNLQDRAR